MHHWDKGISGRLQRVSAPIEQSCEVSVQSEQMDPLPEEQQSQQATPMNPAVYKSMRGHIHPLRVSTPSYIIPPVEEVAVRPYLVPLCSWIRLICIQIYDVITKGLLSNPQQ